MNHKFSLHFSSVRSRVTTIFNSNLSKWGKYFGMCSTVCCGLMHSGKPFPLIICKGRRTPEKVFLRWIDKIDVEGKQFITIEPTRIHTKDGRTYNGNLRYTIHPIEDAIHFLSRAAGVAALDAICTHSADFGFCLGFEHNLIVIWPEYANFYRQAG